eukprot:2156193-Alexandrium_andersonii.AAC.1
MAFLRSRAGKDNAFENGDKSKAPMHVRSRIGNNYNHWFDLWLKSGRDWGQASRAAQLTQGPCSHKFGSGAFRCLEIQ